MANESPEDWAQRMFGVCDLGDQRRTKRLVQTAGQLARWPGASLSSGASTEAAKLGAYRLVENPAIEPEAISEGGWTQTAAEAARCGVLLAASDTTTATFKHAAVQEQLGDVGGPVDRGHHGYHVHSSLLMDGHSGVTVGLIDQQWWTRSPSERGRRHACKQRAYVQKESVKWQRASERMAARLGPLMGRVIELCDAEADVYEYLAYKQRSGQRYIVRIGQDRGLSDQDRRLWSHLAKQPEVGRTTLEVAQQGGRRARTATLVLRATQVTLRPPHRRGGKLTPMAQSAVLVEEVDAPAESTPLRWRLYTSEPIATAEQVRQVADHYRHRWRVEQFHREWKSGCKLEEARQQTADNLQRLGRTQAFVAVRRLQLRELAHWQPDEPCDRLLERDQWQCLWLSRETEPLPEEPPSARWAFYAVARLGGWHDSKRTGRVGAQAICRGWQRLADRVHGYRLAHQSPNL